MASNAKALSFLSGDLSLSGTEVSINVAGSVQSDSITGSTITMKNTGSTIVASDGTTAVLSESGGAVTLTADSAVIGGSSSGDLVRITQTGSGNALVVEDSTNPDSTPFVVNSSGNVGIGNSSPYYPLQVSRNVSAGTLSSGGNLDVDYSGQGIQLGTQSTATSNGVINVGSASGSCIFSGWNGSTNVERMRIDSSGRVGIGTDSPNSLCEIRGSLDGQNVLHLSNSAGTSDGGAENQIRVTCNGNTNWGDLDIQAYTTIFTQNNVPRMRIDSSGNLLVGTTSAVSNQGVIQAKTAVVNGPGAYSASNTNYNSGNSNWTFGMNGLGAFVVYINPGVGGNAGVYLNAGATSWTGNSDERLKDITGNIENAIDSVQSLRAVKYTLKADNAEIKTQRVGLIAQDVQAVLPEIIDEDQDGYLGIRYAEITTLLVAAIKEQQTIIESQQSQIDALTTKTQEQDLTIASLISRIEALENA